MAKLRFGNEESMYSIKRFLGLNENPDGDTELAAGEAAAMRNFRVTKDGSLQIRPGYKALITLADGHPVRGLWHGYVGSAELLKNGSFKGSLDAWTAGAGWSYDGGAAVKASGTASALTQSLTLAAETSYRVCFNLVCTDGTLTLSFGSMTGTYALTATDTYTYDFTAASAGSFQLTLSASSDFEGSIDGVTVKALPLSQEYLIGVCNGSAYILDLDGLTASSIGTLVDAPTTMFGFGNKLYFLNGSEYKYWDGTAFGDVEGYVPLVYTACSPTSGGGTALQEVNKLCGKRRIQFSGTGSALTYTLGETYLESVDKVYSNGVLLENTNYGVNLTTGKVTFDAAPASGTNNVEFWYTKGTGDRETITKQLYCEMYNGSTDSRIFLYGDGTNKAYYSGLEYDTGNPTAEYFPDLNVLDVGDENTPITSMIRQSTKLLTFKKDGGTYLTDFDYMTLDDGTVTAAFYTKAIEKDIGNDSPGQVKLVNNYPLSLQGNSAYRWGLVYSSGVQDERSAKRISDPVTGTLGGMDLTSAVTFDDEWNREFWISQNGTACVYQYAGEARGDTSYKNNLWYVYAGIPATCFSSVDGEVYFGSSNGRLMRLSRDYRSDAGEEISAYWESGSISFRQDSRRKCGAYAWVSILPESQSRVAMTAESNRTSDYDERTLSSGLSTFLHVNFEHFSFGTNRKPQVRRVKLRVRKFTYYKLIFRSVSSSATATILGADIQVRFGGNVK